jgi:hypothetical protein
VDLADDGVARDAGAEAAGDDGGAEAFRPQLLEQFDPFGRPGLTLGLLFLLHHHPISPNPTAFTGGRSPASCRFTLH